jgi:serine/threonine-protein kinase
MTDVMSRLAAALADRYRIERQLGQGGMATVYLARDLRHDREVAIKVVHPDLGAVLGAERFLAEIKTTARLQHPHILALLDSGRAAGPPGGSGADDLLYYVMPYVQGESLRDRLVRDRQLPVPEAVRIAREVASALDYAHRQGVIHRDIKPENILLQDGQALVADFGIALAVQTAGGERMTQTGLSLGTPSYMSPEQAMGERAIDARSDIYALGAVTYEMLTGEPPFTGATVQAIVAKVMSERPTPIRTVRDTVPEPVEDAVLTALAKLPADRFATPAEFASALDGRAVGRSDGQTRRSRSLPSNQPTIRLLLGGLLGLGALAAWGWFRPSAGGPKSVSRQQVVLWKSRLPSPLDPGAAVVGSQFAIAPDGSSIVFSDSGRAGLQLWRKPREAAIAVPIEGTDGAVSPFFSPDGKWIGYHTLAGQVRKVAVDGGGSVTLAEDGRADYKAAAWLDDGTIVYSGVNGTIGRVPAGGGPATKLQIARQADGPGATTLVGSDSPTFGPLPGSRGFLVTDCGGNCSLGTAVYVVRFDSDTARLLVPDAAGAWYAPTGHLLYTAREGGLYAAPFDLDRMEVTGGAIPVLEGVEATQFTFSASGAALYSVDATTEAPSELVWVTRDGRSEPVDSSWRGRFDYPAISPDGKALAVSLRSGKTNLWIRRDDGTRQQVIAEGVANWRPTWFPDGQSLAFTSFRDGRLSSRSGVALQVRADGVGGAGVLVEHPWSVWEVELSQDGEWVVFRSDEEGSNANVRARRRRGDTTSVPLLTSDALETAIALSPDGRWLAYSSDEAGGVREIYVASFPDMQSRQLLSRGGGIMPRWSRDGRELFFVSQGYLMSAAVTPGPAFSTGTPRPLFSMAGFREARNRPQYDVAPDRQRFVMLRESGTSASRLFYVENWLAELRAKLNP